MGRMRLTILLYAALAGLFLGCANPEDDRTDRELCEDYIQCERDCEADSLEMFPGSDCTSGDPSGPECFEWRAECYQQCGEANEYVDYEYCTQEYPDLS